MDHTLLQVDNLKVYFHTDTGVVPAVDNVSFTVNRGETVGVVGESGCGKSVMSLSLLQLLTAKTVRIEAGSSVKLEEKQLIGLKPRELQQIRGDQISMIFQDSMTSLNPVMTIGRQLSEPFRLHCGMTKGQARKEALKILSQVGISSPEKRLRQYPHELSGGMRQRIMIAMALACKPKLLIADEPTTALDVTIQSQILELMRDLKRKTGTSIILVSHDMGVMASMADRIIVMYAGKILETGTTREIFEHPLHPYTSELLASIPRITDENVRLHSIKGTVPDLRHMPPGCSFCQRCPYASDYCREHRPELSQIWGRQVRCFRYQPPIWKGGADDGSTTD